MPSEDVKPRPAHLVLGAGGVRVISSVGVLVKLEELGVQWKSISACSAGSVIGALLAAGIEAKKLMKLVEKEDMRKLAGSPYMFGRLGRFLSPPFARYKSSGIPAFFTESIRKEKNLSEELRLENLDIPFATAGIDVIANELIVYSSYGKNKHMTVSEVLEIAVSVPGLYSPFVKDRQRIVDAAIATNVPVWLAPDDNLPIFVIAPYDTDQYHDLKNIGPKNFGELLGTVISCGVVCRDQYLVSQTPRVRLIEPQCGSIRYDDFKQAETQKVRLMQRGRDAVDEAFVKLGKGLDIFDISNFPARWRYLGDDMGNSDNQSSLQLVRSKMAKSMLPASLRRIFISYAHEEQEWCDRLRQMLDPYGLAVWADREIRGGENWMAEIKQGLNAAKVVILLLSPKFLESPFIKTEELSCFFHPNNKEIKKVPVVVRCCNWKTQKLGGLGNNTIADLQVLHAERPLNDILEKEEQDRGLLQVCESVRMNLDTVEDASYSRG